MSTAGNDREVTEAVTLVPIVAEPAPLVRQRPPLERLAEIVPAGPAAAPVEIPGSPGTSNFSGATSDGRLIDLWLRNKSPKTRQAYAHELERFFDVTGSKPLGQTTLSDLQDFADSAAELFAPRTQRKMLAYPLSVELTIPTMPILGLAVRFINEWFSRRIPTIRGGSQ